jgi:hypothetical protein
MLKMARMLVTRTWKIYEDEEALSQYIRTAVGDYLID